MTDELRSFPAGVAAIRAAAPGVPVGLALSMTDPFSRRLKPSADWYAKVVQANALLD